MLSASRRQSRLLHVSAVDRRQTWSMDKSWRCVTLSGFLHSHTVHCRWNPISCGMHYSGPGLSENDSAVTTDVGEDQNWKSDCGSTTKVELTTVADCQSSLYRLVTSIVCKSLQSDLHDSRRSGGGWKTSSYNGQSRWNSAWMLANWLNAGQWNACTGLLCQHLWPIAVCTHCVTYC